MVRTLLHWHSESPNVNSVALSARGGVLLDPITIDEIVGDWILIMHSAHDVGRPRRQVFFVYDYIFYMYSGPVKKTVI